MREWVRNEKKEEICSPRKGHRINTSYTGCFGSAYQTCVSAWSLQDQSTYLRAWSPGPSKWYWKKGGSKKDTTIEHSGGSFKCSMWINEIWLQVVLYWSMQIFKSWTLVYCFGKWALLTLMLTVTPIENHLLHWYTCIKILYLYNGVNVDILIVLVS